jgi:hypothetical protein
MPTPHPMTLAREGTALLIVDVQERIFPAMDADHREEVMIVRYVDEEVDAPTVELNWIFADEAQEPWVVVPRPVEMQFGCA